MQTVRNSFISLILSYKVRKNRCCFFPCLFEHTIHHMIDCCVLVGFLFPPEEPLQWITFFYQILLVVGDPILLGGFKMVYGVLDQLVLVSISVGHGVYGDFILDNIHECWIYLNMVHLEGIFIRVKRLMDRKLDLMPAPVVSLLEMLWGL